MKPQETILYNAHVIDPMGDRVFHGGVILSEGHITHVFEGPRPDHPDPGLDCMGAYLAPGIVDVGVKIGEPGERHKESFKSASSAALRGGITTMIMRPDTSPAIDTPEMLSFVKARAHDHIDVHLHICGALTHARAGQTMTEIGFMRDAGAIGFGDCDRPIVDTKIALRTYDYTAMMGGIILGSINDPYLSAGAHATSGAFATKLGLPSVTSLAESIGLGRELVLAQMTGVRYHIEQITTEAAIEILKTAKTDNPNLSAGISIHHLLLNELDIANFRTFFKFTPPLRAESDRRAAIMAVKSGIIDVICSRHTPHDEESKRLPFAEAAPGAVGLETLLPASLRLYHAGDLTLPELFRALSLNPARSFGLKCGRIETGAPADLVLFDPDLPFILDRWKLVSKSKNTPFDGEMLQGRVLRTWVMGKAWNI